MMKKILLITPASPFELKSGGHQRTSLIFSALETCGTVDVLLIEPGNESYLNKVKAGNLMAHGIWKKPIFGINKFTPDSKLTEQLNSVVNFNSYDLIVGRYLEPICKIKLPPNIPKIVDLDDWGYQYGGLGRNISSILKDAKSTFVAWLARKQLGRFDAFFWVSERDKLSVSHHTGEVLPNIPFYQPDKPYPQSSSKNILFVGALWYGPNRDGIEYFLSHCWEEIIERIPDATLTIAGGASPSVRANWERYPSVSAPGYVDNLDILYKDSSITIAPIFYGGGTNIKILESLAYGRTSVVTERCAYALGGEGELLPGVVVAHTGPDWVEACSNLLLNVNERDRLSKLGHSVITTKFNKNEFSVTVQRLANTVCSAV